MMKCFKLLIQVKILLRRILLGVQSLHLKLVPQYYLVATFQTEIV